MAALHRNDFRGFGIALDRGPDALGLIAEVKKASPSAGVIAAEFDPVAIAKQYEAAGVHAVGVTWGGIHSRERMEAERPDAVVDTAEELYAAL